MIIRAVQRDGNRLRIINQTKLPLELEYLALDDYRQIIRAIKELQVRGAPAIGIAAAYALAVAVEQTDDYSLDYLERVGRELKATRPTAVNLSWAVDRVLKTIKSAGPASKETALPLLWAEAEAIHNEDRVLCERIGHNGSELIGERATILTHCNAGALATGGIGTALGIIYTCVNQGKKIHVYVDETRPLLQGARLTTWELQQARIDATLITDSTAGMLMRQKKISHVIVGADRIAKNGDFANKIGTYSLAVLAGAHNVPFYVAAPYSTFDKNIETGDEIMIEERSELELTDTFGRRIAPYDFPVYAPAFDITPHALVSCYVTDQGVNKGGRG